MCVFNMLSINTILEMYEANGTTFEVNDGCIVGAEKGCSCNVGK